MAEAFRYTRTKFLIRSASPAVVFLVTIQDGRTPEIIVTALPLHWGMSMPRTLASANPLELAVRRAKVACFQGRRLVSWAARPRRWRVPEPASAAAFPHAIYHHERTLTRADAGADPVLEAGKRVNLALAAPHFDGLVLAPGQVLSFWRVLGRATEAHGFRHGTEVREGCIVPTIGGGLCALSNALFRMACELGWDIVERHGHTREAAPSEDRVWGLDATVFWPHVDLRIGPRDAPGHGPVRLGMTVTGDVLRIRVDAAAPARARVVLESADDATRVEDGMRIRRNRVLRTIVDPATGGTVGRDVVAVNQRQLLHAAEQRRSCLTCGELACHARPRSLATWTTGATGATGATGPEAP